MGVLPLKHKMDKVLFIPTPRCKTYIRAFIDMAIFFPATDLKKLLPTITACDVKPSLNIRSSHLFMGEKGKILH